MPCTWLCTDSDITSEFIHSTSTILGRGKEKKIGSLFAYKIFGGKYKKKKIKEKKKKDLMLINYFYILF